ncbi:NADP oxidoreductase [Ornithinimicrobium avium]|uniref:ferredoxin--NADP(+) reductase n=1 Tax=Ornithinimicrobium avium TaxID=2283195 RepID=A0A345NQH8_9MICO|nr:NADP oxidoreductase [Ornithinimicrobium avium]
MVGSGPAGMYAAALLAQDERVDAVDVLDAHPTPFGLVRHGVAPDHHSTMSVAQVLTRTLELDGVRFFGNVTVGKDVSRAELLERYDVVVYAVGVDRDRELGVPGVVGSLPLIEWYTGLPGCPALDLSGVRSTVVVGGGNVALDVARLLLLDAAELRRSAMPDDVLLAYSGARVEQVHLVIRRSALDVKFSVPMLRELLAVPGLGTELDPPGLPPVPDDLSGVEGRQVAKRLSLFAEAAARTQERDDLSRLVVFHFGSEVVEVGPAGPDGAAEVVLERSGREPLVLTSGLTVSAIGYHGTRVPDLRYDESTSTIPNADGLVTGNEPGVAGREFVVGWAGRAPTGVIGTNRSEAARTVETIWRTVGEEVPARPRPGVEDLAALLHGRGVRFVDADGWRRIEAAERERGVTREAPQVRINDPDELLSRGTSDR